MIGSHWIVLYTDDNHGSTYYDEKYFDSFGVEHIPTKIKRFIGINNISTNIYRKKVSNSICEDTFVLDLLILCLKVKIC